MSLETIAKTVADCEACELCKRRHLPVPGNGPSTASIVLIGEGPGNEEDLSGQPFVGPAGQLLTRLLKDAGIKRSEVFLTNVVKCRTPDNRDPETKEVTACRQHLAAQLQAIQPKVVVTLGRPAAQSCTGHYGPVQGLQEVPNLQTHMTGEGIPVVVAYHPGYLLRLLKGDRKDKIRARRIYDDFKVRFDMALAISRGEVVQEKEEGIDIGALLG